MNKLTMIMERYRHLSIESKSSLWFIFCSILQKGVQFVYTPVMTRLLSTSEYGIYCIFLSWYDIISILATLNLAYYVLNNGLIKYKDDKKEYVLSLQSLGWITTSLFFVIFLVFQSVWTSFSGLSISVMLLMFVELYMKPSFDLYSQYTKFDYQYREVVILTIVLWILIPLLSIGFIFCMNDRGIAAITGRVIGFCIISVYPLMKIKKNKIKLKKKVEYWKYALKFNIPQLPHYLSGIVLGVADRIMIERMVGKSEAGIYSLAYSIASVTTIVNYGILSSFTPYTYKELNESRVDGVKKKATIYFIIIATLNILMIVIAPELLKIMGGERYIDALNIIPTVTMSGLYIFMFNLMVNVEYVFEEQRFVPVASVLAATCNIILNYVFIKKYGYVAAGYTTLVTYIIYAFGHYMFSKKVSKKHLGLKSVYNDKALLCIVLLSTMVSVMEQKLFEFVFIRYFLLIIAIIVIIFNRKRITVILKT